MRSTIKRTTAMLAVAGLVTSCGSNNPPTPPVKSTAAPALSQSVAIDIATEAYVYAYPLVTVQPHAAAVLAH
ncbi:MAG TPA: hypothetical protein VIO95_14365, partial [Mycobacterium sp.]